MEMMEIHTFLQLFFFFFFFFSLRYPDPESLAVREAVAAALGADIAAQAGESGVVRCVGTQRFEWC
jgi:hypothetical protein